MHKILQWPARNLPESVCVSVAISAYFMLYNLDQILLHVISQRRHLLETNLHHVSHETNTRSQSAGLNECLPESRQAADASSTSIQHLVSCLALHQTRSKDVRTRHFAPFLLVGKSLTNTSLGQRFVFQRVEVHLTLSFRTGVWSSPRSSQWCLRVRCCECESHNICLRCQR